MQCGMRNISKVAIVKDSLTGEVLMQVPLLFASKETIQSIIADAIWWDLNEQHGIIISYGYKPKVGE